MIYFTVHEQNYDSFSKIGGNYLGKNRTRMLIERNILKKHFFALEREDLIEKFSLLEKENLKDIKYIR